jgi:peptidoglycan hydrolase-like protein with peptidoglycan-binding domain
VRPLGVTLAAVALLLGMCSQHADARAERPIKVTVECPWEEFGDTLSITEHGSRVLEMQTRLNWAMDKIGAPRIDVDGCFDLATKRAVERFQRWKGLTVDGRYGPCTRAVMEGGPGCGTIHTRAVPPPTATAPPTTQASAPTPTTQPPERRPTGYVVKIDESAQRISVRAMYGERIGEIVLGPAPVTTSRKITRPYDTITCKGYWKVGYAARRTGKLGLSYFLQFCGGQGVHAYNQVGPGYDSGGCGRTPWAFSRAYWSLFVSESMITYDGKILKPGAIRVMVTP